jgi:hypothetical protein
MRKANIYVLQKKVTVPVRNYILPAVPVKIHPFLLNIKGGLI